MERLGELRFAHLVVGVTDRAAGYQPDRDPFEIAGERMLFGKDPDGTAVEFIEFPGAARTSEELHRGVRR